MNNKETSCDARIAWIIDHYRPDQYDDLIREEDAWPFFYHLSSLRAGLLNWYPFEADWRVLELGGGFGALTGCIAEHVAAVDVLEANPLRAAAIQKRYGGNARIRVIEGDIFSLSAEAFADSYDCVVLIDALEAHAQRKEALLSRCAAFLRPGGRLLCGYRNRFGLKYLCGAVDDMQEKPFENMSAERSRFLLRGEVDRLMADAGLTLPRYYYPLPDPYFTQAVYTDSVEKIDSVRDRVFALNPFSATRVADESALYDDVIHANLLPKLASYYLAEYRREPAEGPSRAVVWAALSTDRGKEHGFATVCYDDSTVEKKALWKEGREGLSLIYRNLEQLSSRGLLTVPQKMKSDAIEMPLVTETPLLQHIRGQMGLGASAVIAVFDQLREDILQSSEPVKAEEKDCLLNWGVGASALGSVLAEGMIDMIPYNAFWTDGRIRYYDQEFCVPNCPVGYILFRAIRYTWLHIPALEELLPIREIKAHFQLEENWWAYQRREDLFVASNRNYARFPQIYRWAGKASSPAAIERNRNALLYSDPREARQDQLRAVHKVQLGLLREFDRVCRELGLRYFAIHGTLLGAVRHQGFIPWDDDVDLAMPRADFDRLLEKAPKLLKKNYFLQSAENEDACFYGGYAKLRDSNTTAIEPQNRGRRCNQGIWIDILPLDNCPPSARGLQRLQRRITLWQRFLLAKIYRPESGMFADVDPKLLSFYFCAARCLRRRWILRRLDSLFRSCGETGNCAILACCYGEKENRNMFQVGEFSEPTAMAFEDVEIPVPHGYDRILTTRYGSAYMNIPSAAKQYSHGKVIFSADHPWWKEG